MKLFTGMVKGVENALEVLEWKYGLDVEQCRSLLSSIYGTNVEDDIPKLEHEQWDEEWGQVL